MSEQRPELCPGGHMYVGGEFLVGWEPCGCTVGHTGHRTYWCQHRAELHLLQQGRPSLELCWSERGLRMTLGLPPAV
jgi:hypothetical protein